MLLDLVQLFLRATVSLEFELGTFNKLTVSITNITACTIWVFTGPSTIIPSLHRQRACIFKLFTPLALFSDAT